MKPKRSLQWLVVLPVLVLAAGHMQAADYYARTAGAGTITTNWNQNTTWTASTNCNGAATAGVPGAADNVFICAGKTVNITAAAAANSVTFITAGAASTLNHTATNTLTVGAGGVIINGSSSANGTRLWNIAAGTGTVNGPVTLVRGSSNNRIARINLSTGTLDVNGDLTMTTAGNAGTVIAATGAANIFVSNNFALTNDLGTLTPGATSTFTYDTAAAASVATGGAIQYRNLTINKSGGTATTLSAPGTRNFTVLGALDVQSGTLDIAGVNAAVTGATDVSGTLQISSTTGTKTFAGAVTIAGAWNNSADEDVAMGNSLTNDGTFTSGAGAYTFQTTAATEWAGSSGLTFSGNVAVNATRTNNTTTSIVGNLTGSSTLTNAANQTLHIGGNASGITGLNATAAGNTVNYNGTAAQAAENTTYHHLTISNTTGPVTLPGNINIQGNLINDGNFEPATGNRTVTFNGAAAQTISGTATIGGTPNNLTTFYRIVVNNANGVAMTGAHDVTITNLLTLTTGPITTNANVLYIANGSAIGSAGGNDFVIGNLRKNYTAGANVTRVFEVGSGLAPGARYAPLNIRFGSVTAAGDFTVSTTGGDHPNIGTSTLDPALSVNRYWTLIADSVGFTANANNRVIFTFVNPGDLDGGAATGSFFVSRHNAPNWTEITPSARAANTTTIAGAGITTVNIAGDYQIGERAPVVPPPADFNAFETSTAPNAITGRLFTKLVGSDFQVAIVAILAGVQHATFTNTVAVDLVTGSTGGLNCPGTPMAIAGTAQNVNLTVGRGTTGNFNVASVAYRDVRVRIRFPVVAPTVTACSTDNFAIRPTGFTVSSTNATQTGSSGSPAIKTGANFNLTAMAIAGYDGTPAINNALVAGTPNAGTIGGSFNAAPVGTGIADGNTFYYSEVGNFGLGVHAVFDDSFASVDSGASDCTNDFSNVLVGGRYGCSFGSTAVPQSTGVSGFGRFIPDNFNVSYNAPAFAAACSGFSYVGQTFNYTAAPVLTVMARKGTNNGLDNSATTNYAGSYMKFTNASLAQVPYNIQAGRYTRFDALGGGNTPALDLSGLPATAADPAVGAFINGIGTFTFAGGSGISFMRSTTTPSTPFDADIELALNVIDGDGVTYPTNPAKFGQATAGSGIVFSTGKAMRYGRLRLGGASGSQLLALDVPFETQYWTGTFFATNTLDTCTTVAVSQIGMGNYIGSLNSGDTAVTGVSALSGGRGVITLGAPGAGNSGSVDLAINLGSDPNAAACPAFTPAAVPGEVPWLRGQWCGAAYDKDPAARIRFGIQAGSDERIYMRENYQ
ncbi:MAG: hypothetical protein Q8L95_13980 [Burkholderiales bacterium]|nr:hypothetical protein [Burkholderiales bacterium]